MTRFHFSIGCENLGLRENLVRVHLVLALL